MKLFPKTLMSYIKWVDSNAFSCNSNVDDVCFPSTVVNIFLITLSSKNDLYTIGLRKDIILTIFLWRSEKSVLQKKAF